MRAAGKHLEKHRVPKSPQLLEILTLEISNQCKRKEQGRRRLLLAMDTHGQCESVVELLRRILARPHEIFEVSRRIGRRWRVGHGAALQSNSRGYPGTWPSITVGFCNSTGEHDRTIMQDRLSTIWSLAVAGAGARPASAHI